MVSRQSHKLKIVGSIPTIRNQSLCPGGGMVYTAVLEAVPETVASSSLAWGTIYEHTYRSAR